MDTVELQQRFSQAQQDNEFFAAKTMWDANQTRACIFFRPAWRSREAAYAVAVYIPADGAYIAVEQSLDAALTILRKHGYADEPWQTLDRTGCHHNIAPIDEERLWNAGYGVVSQRGLSKAEWRETTITVPGPLGGKRSGKRLGESGLGYWISTYKGEPTFYVPTHILSGYTASSATFYSEEVCQQYLKELAPLMNWNQPLEQLAKDADYQPDKFNALAKKFWIEDAAQSAGGGRW